MLASGAAISLAAPDKRISQIPDAFTDDHIGLMDLPDDFVAAAFSLEKSLYLQFRIFLNQQVSAFAGLPTNRVNPGGRLPAETYFCDACRYEVMPCMLSSMRQKERYPLHAIIPDEIDYFYLRLLDKPRLWNQSIPPRRRTCGVPPDDCARIPKALTTRKPGCNRRMLSVTLTV